MGLLRIFLALLIVDWVLGIPGLGLETRTNSSDLMNWIYGVAFLALIVALALTWFRPAWAGALAMAVGGIAVLLAIADTVGLTSGQPAPGTMILVDLGGAVIGAAIVWAASLAGRSIPLMA